MFKHALLLSLILLAVTPTYAWAYLDPGTGSMIFQALCAAFVGALFSIKMFWGNIKGFFTSLLKRSHDQND